MRLQMAVAHTQVAHPWKFREITPEKSGAKRCQIFLEIGSNMLKEGVHAILHV
jgi:hypothetical protein